MTVDTSYFCSSYANDNIVYVYEVYANYELYIYEVYDR
jgi:hypothetical protein